MIRYLLLVPFLLVGCSLTPYFPGPTEEPPKDSYDVRIKFHKAEDLPVICNYEASEGCYQPDTDPCEIYVKKNDWCSIIHELQHCFRGLWHGDKPAGNGRCK